MGFVEVAHLHYALPGGRVLLDDASFRVGEGQKVALVGANGTGKTTLLRLIARDEAPERGSVVVGGRLGVMRQFIGSVRDHSTVRELLLGLAPAAVRAAGAALAGAERGLDGGGDRAGVRYAAALTAWGDAGGYETELLWDLCTTAALGRPLDEVADRPVGTLSGGEQKRLALEALLRGDDEVLLLDEPDNYLDVAGKRWLEQELAASGKTVLYVSHDRELLARTATRVVTLEGRATWVHGGGFAGYHEARQERLARLDEQHRRYREEHKRLVEALREYKRRASISDKFASRAKAMETRIRRFETEERPAEQPEAQKLAMRLEGGRTGVRALTARRLALPGLVLPFDLEVFFGERVAVVGPNGSGKSHFLRLLAGQPVAHEGEWRLGARVVPGWFAQTHDTPEFEGRSPVEILRGEGLDRGQAIGRLRRYELHATADQRWETLSGGQQARLQILLLEVGGATMLLLDEPTDNLDLASAEALEEGLAGYQGTVLAVTHDRWFMRAFDRFLVFGDDRRVGERLEPPEG